MGEITISGKIIFEGNPPSSFIDGSTALIKFVDARRMDVAYIPLGRADVDACTQFSSADKTIKYSLTCKKPEPATYSMNCVINVGWKASGDDWIHHGDYHNDTSHSISIKSDVDKYERDITVCCYT